MTEANFGIPTVDDEVLSAFVDELNKDPTLLRRITMRMMGDNGGIVRTVRKQIKHMPFLAEIEDEELRDSIEDAVAEFTIRAVGFAYGAVSRQLEEAELAAITGEVEFEFDISELSEGDISEAFAADVDSSLAPQSSDETAVQQSDS